MGYNGREFQEPYAMSNGDDLVGSMSNLHVGDQSTSGSSSNPPVSLARTNLNPNAAEFVPMAYKSPEQSEPKPEGDSRLNRSNSINSNASDDEYRKFCRAQLPDDLMPDFDFGDFVETNTEYEEQPAPSTPNWTGNVEQFTYDQRPAAYNPRFEGSTSSAVPRPYLPELRSPVQQQPQPQPQPPQQVNRAWNDISETGTSFSEWGPDLTFPEDLTESVDPITILATEFPGFASESLAEIYYANGGDLALTVDMLSELELQNQAPPAPAPPSPRDFPALAGLDVSGRAESRAVPDFAAAVRKQAAAQQAAQLQFERNGGVDLSLGAVRGLAQGPGFSREPRVAHNETRLEPGFHVHEVQAPVAWLETGDSVANLYAEMREEARDHARVRNAYFDQARQAYLTGNKALAKELSAKGQWHNEQMKAAHNKAGEAIYWQRNSNAYANSAPGQRLIDLHGLHVGEAIPLLKREIAQMRYNVRSSRQRETVFICVGTGHHTKGSRTPSRLPAAVQRYLLEEEHLQFSEPQAGMLRIIIR